MAMPKLLQMLFDGAGAGKLLRADIIPFNAVCTAIIEAFDTAIANCGGTPVQD